MKSKTLIRRLMVAVLLSSMVIALGKSSWLKAGYDPNPSVKSTPVSKAADGFQLNASLQKQTVYIAEPILLTITLTNVTNKPNVYLDTGIYNDFSFVISDQNGVPVPETLYGKSCLISDSNNRRAAAGFRHLSAGQKITYKVFVNALYDMTLGKTYSITAKRKFDDSRVAEAVSNAVTVQVLGERPIDAP